MNPITNPETLAMETADLIERGTYISPQEKDYAKSLIQYAITPLCKEIDILKDACTKWQEAEANRRSEIAKLSKEIEELREIIGGTH